MLTDATIDNQKHAMDTKELNLKECTYHTNKTLLVIQDNHNVSNVHAYPLLPKKGLNIVHHFFLEAFLSINYSKSNSEHRKLRNYNIWHTQRTLLLAALNKVNIDTNNKDIAAVLIKKNIVKMNTYRYFVKKIFGINFALCSLWGTSFFFLIMLGHNHSIAISAFFGFCSIFHYVFWLLTSHKYYLAGTADTGHHYVDINKCTIRITKNK